MQTLRRIVNTKGCKGEIMLRVKLDKEPKVAYRVLTVIALHQLEKKYNVELCDVPAIYIKVGKQILGYGLEQEEKVKEKYNVSIIEMK